MGYLEVTIGTVTITVNHVRADGKLVRQIRAYVASTRGPAWVGLDGVSMENTQAVIESVKALAAEMKLDMVIK